MNRRIDCRKYWKWKRQQEKKLKKKGKTPIKRKRKESVTDCIEIEQSEAPETLPRIRQPKIKKKKKEVWSLMRPLIKRVPFPELVLRCIKPSIEIREQFQNPRHMECLQLEQLDIDVLTPETLQATTSLDSQRRESEQIKDRKKRKYGLRIEQRHVENRGHMRRRTLKRKLIDNSEEEEESESKSICSFDSKICLQGIKLTATDKEVMKKYQTQKDNTKGRQ